MKLFYKERSEYGTIINFLGAKFRFKNKITIPLDYHVSLANLASYSQAGEDKVVDFIMSFFTKIDRSKINYLDIGSNYPNGSNNTFYYYQKGCRGVLIEPNEKLCELSRTIRPGDIVINAGVKFDEKDESTYFSFEDTGINTFDENRAKEMQEKGHELLDKKTIKLVSINDVFDNQFKNKKVDFMSLDAESVDLLILKSIDFNKYRPKVICVEAEKTSLKYGTPNEMVSFMEANDYIIMADTSINYIFLAKEEFSPNAKYV